MWSEISNALKLREIDSDADHSDTQSTRLPPLDADIISSLRTQLTLQREMCAQFEIDLAARDKLVEALTLRLEASEKDNDKRKNDIRSWKKKAAELERVCRHLEDEVDNGRQQNMATSTTDEASGEALRQLRRRISQLERGRSDDEVARNTLMQAKEETEADIHLLKEEKRIVETERDNFSSEISRLRTHIQQLQKDSAVMEVTIVQLNKQHDQDREDINGLNIALESKQQELELVKRKRGTAGLTAGRTNPAPSTTDHPATQPPKVIQNSTVATRASSPELPRAPSALGRAANTRPAVASALRRTSSSSVEAKIKAFSRRASIGSAPSKLDEKENSIPVSLKHTRRPMVPA